MATAETQEPAAPTPTPEPEPALEPEPTPTPEPEPEPEPDEGENGDGEGAEPATEPPETEGLSQAEIEKRFKSIEKRETTWRNTVSDVLGELALDLEPCPRCLPYPAGMILPASKAPVPPEVKNATLVSLGEGVEPPLRQADDAFECGKCDGMGRVLTGSHIPTKRTTICRECTGDGWVGARKQKMTVTPIAEQAPTVTDNGEPEAVPAGPPDWRVTELEQQGYVVFKPPAAS